MYKILIIEAEEAFREILKDEFEKEQFEVILASDGKQGMIEPAKSLPDFILLDLMMPKMNGTTFLTHLNAVKGLLEVPTAVLTAVPDGVPQNLAGSDLFKNIVGFWVKDTLTPKMIIQKVTEYLESYSAKMR